MRANISVDYDPNMKRRVVALGVLFLICAAAAAGAMAAIAVRTWTPPVAMSLVGPVHRGFWYLSRVSGMVGYVLIWFSMALGLLITNKLAKVWPGGPAAFDLHQFTSLLGLGFSIFHAVILLGDPQINMHIAPILVPFVGFSYRPLWIGLGQISLYALLIVTLSFYAKKWIGKKTWRTLHFGSFLLFIGVLLHSLHSSPVNTNPLVQDLYWGTGGSIILLTAYRVVVSLLKRPAAKKRPAAQPTQVKRAA